MPGWFTTVFMVYSTPSQLWFMVRVCFKCVLPIICMTVCFYSLDLIDNLEEEEFQAVLTPGPLCTSGSSRLRIVRDWLRSRLQITTFFFFFFEPREIVQQVAVADLWAYFFGGIGVWRIGYHNRTSCFCLTKNSKNSVDFSKNRYKCL